MTTIPGLDAYDAHTVLLAVEENRRRELAAGADLLALAAHWCDLHGGVDLDSDRRVIPGSEILHVLGGPGTPEVEEFAAAEFGAMRHLHPMAARNLMADALDLRHRLPACWAAVHALRLEAWVARRIAVATRKLSRQAARYVDAAIAAYLESLPTGRLLALVEAKIIEADPALAEAARQRAEESRFVHTTKDSNGLMTLIARARAGDVVVFEAMVDRIAAVLGGQGDEEGIDVRRSKAIGVLAHPAEALRLLLWAARSTGVPDEVAETELTGDDLPEPARSPRASLLDLLASIDPKYLRPQVRLFLHLTADVLTGAQRRVGRAEGIGPLTTGQVRDWLGNAHVTVTPVLDLADQRPVDGYEFPARIVEALHQQHPADLFPWATNTSRSKDTDHTDAYRPPARGGPPGQTGTHNGGRLTRHSHRIKTHSQWTLAQPARGVYLWRSPHGFWFLVDHTGTHRITPAEARALLPHHPAANRKPRDHELRELIEELTKHAAA